MQPQFIMHRNSFFGLWVYLHHQYHVPFKLYASLHSEARFQSKKYFPPFLKLNNCIQYKDANPLLSFMSPQMLPMRRTYGTVHTIKAKKLPSAAHSVLRRDTMKKVALSTSKQSSWKANSFWYFLEMTKNRLSSATCGEDFQKID